MARDGEVDLPDFRAGVFQDFNAAEYRRPYLVVQPFPEIPRWKTDGPAGDTRVDARREVRRRQVHGRGISRVVPGNDVQEERCILHVPRHGANLVQGRRVGNETVAGDPAVSGLETDHAAEGGGKADGAAGIRAQGQHGLVRGHAGGAGAAGASRHARRIVGISRRSVRRVFVR